MFFRNNGIVSYHYRINSTMKYYDKTSFCVSGKTSNMLDNRIAKKSGFGYENSLQKVRISCCSNYHAKLLYKLVCRRLWNFQPSISDAYRAAFNFHRWNNHQIRKQVLDAHYQKSTSRLMFSLKNWHRIIEMMSSITN